MKFIDDRWRVIEDYKAAYSVPDASSLISVWGWIIGTSYRGAIAHSIADRPGTGPGLFMGLIANAIGALVS